MDYLNEPLLFSKKRQMKNKKIRQTKRFLKVFLTAVLCIICFLLGRATSSASDFNKDTSNVMESTENIMEPLENDITSETSTDFEKNNTAEVEITSNESSVKEELPKQESKEISNASSTEKKTNTKVIPKKPTLNASKNTSWNLTLVNPWSNIPNGFTVERTMLKNGHSIDKRAYPDLQAMMDDLRVEGLSPTICSSFRTMEKQQSLFNRKIDYYISQGYSNEEAQKEAAKWVAVPGTSEHQLGLAVDIISNENQVLDESQEKTAVQQWLMKNSYKYGFILRYPSGKSKLTGIGYEPWHYRYVGKEAAKEIYEKGICLEEYLSNL